MTSPSVGQGLGVGGVPPTGLPRSPRTPWPAPSRQPLPRPGSRGASLGAQPRGHGHFKAGQGRERPQLRAAGAISTGPARAAAAGTRAPSAARPSRDPARGHPAMAASIVGPKRGRISGQVRGRGGGSGGSCVQPPARAQGPPWPHQACLTHWGDAGAGGARRATSRGASRCPGLGGPQGGRLS